MGSNPRGRRNAKMNRELRLEISRLGPDIGCRQRQGPGSQMRKAQADNVWVFQRAFRTRMGVAGPSQDPCSGEEGHSCDSLVGLSLPCLGQAQGLYHG